MGPAERPLTEDEFDELREGLAGALTLLGVSRPDQVRDALEGWVEQVREDPAAHEGGLDQAGFLLGLMLGQQICEVAGWQWVYLSWDNGFEAVGVVPEDRSFVCLPVQYTYGLLRDREKQNTLTLLLETLGKGAMPPGTERAYVPLS